MGRHHHVTLAAMTKESPSNGPALFWNPPEGAVEGPRLLRVSQALRLLEHGLGEQAMKGVEGTNDPLGLFATAYILQHISRWDEALDTYAAFAEKRPEAPEAPFNMALCRIARLSAVAPGAPKNLGEAAAARDDLLKARALGLETPLLSFLLGRVYLILGEWRRAAELFHALTLENADNALFWHALGEARERGEDTQGALTAYRQAAECSSDIKTRRTWLQLARKSATREDMEQACLFLVAEQPVGGEGSILKAEALALLGKIEDAGVLAAGISATPEYCSAIALAWAERGDGERAAAALRQALHLEFLGGNTDFARHGDLSPLAGICRARAALGGEDAAALAVCALKLAPGKETEILAPTMGKRATTPPFAKAKGKRTTSKIALHTIVWGEAYVERFLRHTLPSLLTPGNIPALCQGLEAHYIIDTRPEDRRAMETSEPIKALAEYAEVRFAALPEADIAGSTSYMATGNSWRRFIETARTDDRGMFFLIPDAVVAEGGLATVRERMEQGVRAVTALSLTAVDRPFLAALEREPSPVPPYRLAELAFANLHPLVGWLSHGADNYTDWPYMTFWRGEGGALARGFMLHPAYVHPTDWKADFKSTVDWDYVINAVPDHGLIAPITDSDAFMMVEFSDAQKKEPKPGKGFANPFDVAYWAKRNMPPAAWPFFQTKMWLHGRTPREKLAETEAACDLFAEAVTFILNGGLKP